MSIDELMNLKARCARSLEASIGAHNAIDQQLAATWTTNLLLVELILETRNR